MKDVHALPEFAYFLWEPMGPRFVPAPERPVPLS
jgi:hypothetical protein